MVNYDINCMRKTPEQNSPHPESERAHEQGPKNWKLLRVSGGVRMESTNALAGYYLPGEDEPDFVVAPGAYVQWYINEHHGGQQTEAAIVAAIESWEKERIEDEDLVIFGPPRTSKK